MLWSKSTHVHDDDEHALDDGDCHYFTYSNCEAGHYGNFLRYILFTKLNIFFTSI